MLHRKSLGWNLQCGLRLVHGRVAQTWAADYILNNLNLDHNHINTHHSDWNDRHNHDDCNHTHRHKYDRNNVQVDDNGHDGKRRTVTTKTANATAAAAM